MSNPNTQPHSHGEPFTLWVPFPAVAKQRARLGRRRRGRKQVAFTPAATKDFETRLADHVTENLGDHPGFGTRPVCLDIDVHQTGFQVTVRYAESSVRPVGVRGDLDNYVKSISDALNGVLWHDDRQVELLTVGFVGVPRKGTVFLSENVGGNQ